MTHSTTAIREGTDDMTKNTYCLEDVQRLVAWMAENGYDIDAIVYAVEKPWKFWDEMPAGEGE